MAEDVSKLSFEEVLSRTNTMEDSDVDQIAYGEKVQEFRDKNGRDPNWEERRKMRDECPLATPKKK